MSVYLRRALVNLVTVLLLLALLAIASPAGATSPSKGPIRDYLERRDRIAHVLCRILPAARMCRRA